MACASFPCSHGGIQSPDLCRTLVCVYRRRTGAAHRFCPSARSTPDIPAPSRSEVRIFPHAEICNRRSSQEKAGQSAQQFSLAHGRPNLPTSRRSNLFLHISFILGYSLHGTLNSTSLADSPLVKFSNVILKLLNSFRS